MLVALHALALVILTSVMWRARGHRWPDPFGSNFWQRGAWAVYCAAVMTWIFGLGWESAATALGGYVGAMMGHRSYMAAGMPGRAPPLDGERHEAHAVWAVMLPWHRWSGATIDTIGLLWTGALRGALISIPWGWEAGLLASPAFAVAHLAGYWIGNRVTFAGLNWIERGELVAGAFMGLGFAGLWIWS